MKQKLSAFRWDHTSPKASWDFAGVEVVKSYSKPILKAVPLNDQTGVAIVEPPEHAGRDNAVVFNSDGSIRFRIRLPALPSSGYGFWEIYYVQGELTVMAQIGGGDLAIVVDEETGTVLRSYETR